VNYFDIHKFTINPATN